MLNFVAHSDTRGNMQASQKQYTLWIFHNVNIKYSRTCLKQPLKEKTKNLFSRQFIAYYRSKGPLEHCAILFTFIKLPFDIKIFVMSIFEWQLKTGFTVSSMVMQA